SSAARCLMDLSETAEILDALQNCKLLYFSAITLSIYAESGRQRLFAALRKARKAGTIVVFDTNFRSRGWPVLDVARSVYRDAFDVADIVLASTEDLSALYPDESDDGLLARIPSAEVVLKLSSPSSILRWGERTQHLQAEPVTKPVVDTTAAGDSFAAAYIS